MNKKTIEKEFNIYANERPKVLLLGTGINRAFKGPSWDALLDQIKESNDFPLAAKDYNMPMPLKAAMLTDNKIGEKMRELISPKGDDSAEDGKVHWESFVNFEDEEKEYLKKLLDLKFDYILTTNYSYEIEAALSKKDLTRNYLEGLNTHIEVDNAQTRYMLNTFNRISADGNEYNIWHIHGEARKPDSMIIGHNYYGRLLSKIIDRLILMKTYGVIIEPIDENDYEIFYNKVYEKLKAELGILNL